MWRVVVAGSAALSLVGAVRAGATAPPRLPHLPAQGLLIQRPGGVELRAFGGRSLATLPRFRLANDPYPTGTLRAPDGTYRRIDARRRRLVRVPRMRPPRARPHTCTRAASARLLLCTTGPNVLPNVVRLRSGALVGGIAPGARLIDGNSDGFWRYAWLSPDGRTVLAQWSGECESSAVFLSTVGTHRWRGVGGRTLRDVPEAGAYGWTDGGRAIVGLAFGVCGGSFPRPGMYLVDTAGRPVARILDAPRKRPDVRPRGVWGARG